MTMQPISEVVRQSQPKVGQPPARTGLPAAEFDQKTVTATLRSIGIQGQMHVSPAVTSGSWRTYHVKFSASKGGQPSDKIALVKASGEFVVVAEDTLGVEIGPIDLPADALADARKPAETAPSDSINVRVKSHILLACAGAEIGLIERIEDAPGLGVYLVHTVHPVPQSAIGQLDPLKLKWLATSDGGRTLRLAIPEPHWAALKIEPVKIVVPDEPDSEDEDADLPAPLREILGDLPEGWTASAPPAANEPPATVSAAAPAVVSSSPRPLSEATGEGLGGEGEPEDPDTFAAIIADLEQQIADLQTDSEVQSNLHALELNVARKATEVMAEQVAELQTKLNLALEVNQRQSEMLKAAVPAAQGNIGTMTLLQEFENDTQLTFGDAELQKFRNQGWQVVSETVNTVFARIAGKSIEVARHHRIVRLERPIPASPAPQPEAAAAVKTVEPPQPLVAAVGAPITYIVPPAPDASVLPGAFANSLTGQMASGRSLDDIKSEMNTSAIRQAQQVAAGFTCFHSNRNPFAPAGVHAR